MLYTGMLAGKLASARDPRTSQPSCSSEQQCHTSSEMRSFITVKSSLVDLGCVKAVHCPNHRESVIRASEHDHLQTTSHTPLYVLTLILTLPYLLFVI